MSEGWFGALSMVSLALLQCVRRDGGHVSEAQEVHVANGSGAPASTPPLQLLSFRTWATPTCSMRLLRELPVNWSSGMSPDSNSLT